MNLLVTGAWQGGKEHISRLEAMGHEVCFLQMEKDPLPCEAEWVEGAICNGLFLSHPIESFPNLRYIQLTSAGFDRVPMDYVRAHDIEIHNARGVYSIPMAEFAMAGVLQLYKKLAAFGESQRQHKWEKRRDILELFGKTVCILGCGSVGTECAKRFAAFGCTVLGVATSARQQEHFDRIVPGSALEEVLGVSDIVILTLPLTKETRHLIGKDQLAIMKENAILVNMARGAVVDTEALMQALKEKSISGAVLDVFEEEPLNPGSPLWDLDNVLLTPHNSFAGEENGDRLRNIIVRNLEVAK